MREAIGGTWLFQIAIVFILLFAGYLALSVNYSRSFKVKNEILSIIERNEGLREKARNEITNYLTSANHTVVGKCDSNATGFGDTKSMTSSSGIYCVEKVCDDSNISLSGTGLFKAHYKITVFFKFDLPIVGDIFTFRVEGETKTIFNAPSDAKEDLKCSER